MIKGSITQRAPLGCHTKVKNKMNIDPFQRSRLRGWGLVAIFVAMPLIFTCLIVKPKIVNNDWDIPTFAILIAGGWFLVSAYFCYSPVVQLLTKYTHDEIVQPSLLGSKILSWRQVQEVRNLTDTGMNLVSGNLEVTINFRFFKAPQNLLAAIRSRIPLSAFPSDAKINQQNSLRKRNTAAVSAVINFLGAVYLLIYVQGLATSVLGVVFIAIAVFEVYKWIKLNRAQP